MFSTSQISTIQEHGWEVRIEYHSTNNRLVMSLPQSIEGHAILGPLEVAQLIEEVERVAAQMTDFDEDDPT